MSNSTVILGNLANDPQLREAGNRPVCNFRIASNRRYFDSSSQEWKESDPLYLDVAAWGNVGKNVAKSLHKGDAVIVTGRLHTEEFTPKDSDRVATVVKLTATTVGVDLRYTTATIGMDEAVEGE